ncbi:MAG: 4a-hydroxytetrahydrobiopterin dehydratase [Gemmatimonadota bacterium]
MSDLIQKHCVPCSGETPPLTEAEIGQLKGDIPDWEVTSGHKLVKQFTCEDFLDAIDFVNAVAELAEEEGHHPSITIDYKVVTFTIWTHAIDDLSESDFILAAKIDAVFESGTVLDDDDGEE